MATATNSNGQPESSIQEPQQPQQNGQNQNQPQQAPKPQPQLGSQPQSKQPEQPKPPQQNGNPSLMKKIKSSPSAGLKQAVKPKKPPGGFDSTPIPDAPQGYTLRFCFHSASNLPPADLSTASSDPFLTATLKTTAAKRHKEDPDLVHRTRTIRRTTEPKWEEEWIVANVPASGFTLKCRLYDEDSPDQDDRLGNVTLKIPRVYEEWEGIPPPGRVFACKKRMMSKRAFMLKGLTSLGHSDAHITPRLCLSVQVLGLSEPPHGQMYTLGPTMWTKHFSPMIGRIAGTKVNKDEQDDQSDQNERGNQSEGSNSAKAKDKRSKKYDFQANEMQLRGPVPEKLYHRYVEFRPIIGSMFASTGLRGKILNTALHKQHNRVYNFDQSTEWGSFEACSKEAAQMLLRLAHFDEGGRVFTYVLTLDGIFRFTETGKEFGIDLLSKHTMHSNVETYIACSGEFFIRRLEHPDASEDLEPPEKTHPDEPIPGGPPNERPPANPSYYQLVIDNDSGTYRPDKSTLPQLKEFLERNFPGLGVITMHWEEDELQKLKENQHKVKKNEGRMINVVMNRSMSSISSAESELSGRDETWESGKKSKREVALEAIANPSIAKDAVTKGVLPKGKAAGIKA